MKIMLGSDMPRKIGQFRIVGGRSYVGYKGLLE